MSSIVDTSSTIAVVSDIENFSARYPVPDTVILSDIANAPTVEVNPPAEEKQEGVQWKPSRTTDSSTTRRRVDYTATNSDPDGAVSLAMPFVHKGVRPAKVFAVMRRPFIEIDGDIEQVNFGFITRIDYIFRKDGNKTYFIHFEKGRFNKNELALAILERMANGERFKIFNDREQRHFWWTSVSKAKRPEDKGDDENGTSADITFDLQ